MLWLVKILPEGRNFRRTVVRRKAKPRPNGCDFRIVKNLSILPKYKSSFEMFAHHTISQKKAWKFEIAPLKVSSWGNFRFELSIATQMLRNKCKIRDIHKWLHTKCYITKHEFFILFWAMHVIEFSFVENKWFLIQ